jgi:mannose/fructose/N-acetylgalactosamine-specific phosphotransferase system component IID
VRELRRSDRLRAWIRSFAVHGTWNHRTLLGAGLAYALLPVLRRLHVGDPVTRERALNRYLRTFNAHPYLASAAVGALARLEAEGTDEEALGRFHQAVSGPLGSLGDRVVWSAWRPFCALGAGVAYLLGLPAGWAVAAFVIVYNLGHLALRQWAFRLGWTSGLELGSRLRSSPLAGVGRILTPLAVVFLGAVTTGLWLVASGPGGSVLAAAALAAAVVAGYVWPVAGRVLAPLSILVIPLAGWLLI